MTEIIVHTKKDEKIVALLENGRLVEYYEEDDESKRKEGNIYIGIVKIL